jgi:hypothetical protein
LENLVLQESRLLLLKCVVEDLVFIFQVDEAELELVDFYSEFFGHFE